MDLHTSQVAVGTVVATGEVMNIQCGFKPRVVEIYNETTPLRMIWTHTMAAGKGHKQAALGDGSFVAANGISQYSDPALTNKDGFTLGTDSINTNTNVLHYIARR